EVPFYSHRNLAHLIMSGVFERFPKLRYVMTEQGVAWLVEELRRMDGYHRQMRAGRVGELGFAADIVLPHKPSEYFDRNVWIGASFPSPGEADAIRKVGVHKVMWGSDYPHHEGTYPYSLESLQRAFSDWSEAEMRAVLGGNAADLYGFDLDRLAPLATEHGPTVEQVATPLAEIPAKATSPAFFKP
ncbi:MAG: amidohydrolase family protein, partial [Acidimicrobiaceae bacterium]|nr:amidohydrolase family protein [Acidimicrobiaceae bacterium]